VSLEAELASLRLPLLKFARLQLHDAGAAEDAVSEVLLAILERPEAFEGRSSLRTYATGILKFKLIDHLRRRQREVPITPADDQSMDEAIEALFAADGHYLEPQPAWALPERAAESARLQAHLQDCIERLPERLARVFMMREWLEKEVSEICAELDITANHCGVLLYRARMRLRTCLQLHGVHGAEGTR
jgi:RNA polymerase sigma-70 factor (ECF subfamily)